MRCVRQRRGDWLPGTEKRQHDWEEGTVEFTLDSAQWAKEQFGDCLLGDKRRTRRAVAYAKQVVENPSGSTPEQTEDWNDCKAAYRLFGQQDVTFEALARPHWQRTRNCPAGEYLLLGDTTELDYGKYRQVKGLGPTGNGGGQGFLLHSALMVAAQSEAIVGLAGQEIFLRRPRPRNESRYDRSQRSKESDVWGRVIDEIACPPESVTWTHVLDRGADNFEVYCHLLQNQCAWVVRARHLNRLVQIAEKTQVPLFEHLATLPIAGTYELKLRACQKSPARTARLAVRMGQVGLPQPKLRSPYVRRCGIGTITMDVVEVREINPPRGVAALHWVLYTSHRMTLFKDAWRIIEYYEKRWLIEEFHKALKTGCRAEERQYAVGKRLAALAGLLSVVAVRLLQLKAVARDQPDCPAQRVIPRLWLRALQILRKRSLPHCTVRQFYRHLAALGGFLGRKNDGEPGWIVLWRGFDKLALASKVLENAQKYG